MGLLDGIISNVLNGQQGHGPLLDIAMQLISQRGQNGAGGGLNSIVDALNNAGLQEQLKSWIGTGENLPISGDQLTQALGSDKIRDIAGQLGMSQGEVSGGLAGILPQLIDKISPQGRLPEQHSLVEDALAMLMRR